MRELTISEQEAVNGGNFWGWFGKVCSAGSLIASYAGEDDAALELGLLGLLC